MPESTSVTITPPPTGAGAPKPPAPPTDPLKLDETVEPTTPPETPPVEPPKPNAPVVTDADLETYAAEFAEKGSLSDETLTALEAKGIPKALAMRVVEGQAAIAAQVRADIVSVVGGEQKFGELQKWANENLSKEEKGSFNKVLDTKDPGQIKIALTAIQAKHAAKHGSAPSQVAGKATAGGGIEPYANAQQMLADQANPKYKADPAFREMVSKRVAASSFWK